MLGGGHGWLQGQYGLLADNILSLDLVLADGTALTASSTQHPALFWALRGAGHNFGIVTSVEYRIYDVPVAEEEQLWAYEEYIFAQDRLEPLFDFANTLIRTEDKPQPVELTHYGHFEYSSTEIDADVSIDRLYLHVLPISFPAFLPRPRSTKRQLT